MKALFLESKAAAQVRAYAAAVVLDEAETEDLLNRAYTNGEHYANHFANAEPDDLTYDDWWVSKCLDEDSHKSITIDHLMIWSKTPEGMDFWLLVSLYGRA